jgi:hypothetical protein
MNRFVLVMVSALVLFLSACGGGSSTPAPTPTPTPTPSNGFAGTYNGEVSVLSSTPAIQTNATYTIKSNGELSGTITGKPNSDTPAEKGTVTGTVKDGTTTGLIEVNITVEMPSVGRYTLTGSGAYSGKQLAAASLTVKDASGTSLGLDGSIIGNRE